MAATEQMPTIDIEDLEFSIPDGVEEILMTAFNIGNFSKSDIFKNFKNEFYTGNGTVQAVKRQNFKPHTSNTHFLQAFDSSDYTVGIDFPVLIQKLNKQTSVKKYVFIVGEDPIRVVTNYTNENKNKEIVVSTPYAPQNKAYRNGRGKLYWGLFPLFNKSRL